MNYFDRKIRGLWAYISERYEAGQVATVPEIRRDLGYSSTSVVVYHLQKLVKAGYVRYEAGTQLAYVVVFPLLRARVWPVRGASKNSKEASYGQEQSAEAGPPEAGRLQVGAGGDG